MPVKSGLFALIITAVVVRSSTPIKRGCYPSGFRHFETFMTFRDAEDTGMLWMYALYSPLRPKKLSRCQMILRTRSLIITLLLIGCVESHPGELLQVLFFIILAALFLSNFRKVHVCNL